jgi:hypothetical protein
MKYYLLQFDGKRQSVRGDEKARTEVRTRGLRGVR